MKKLSVLLLIFVLFACDKKSPEPEPALSAQVKGIYEAYSISYGTKVLLLGKDTPGILFELIPVDANTCNWEITSVYPDGTTDTDKSVLNLSKNGDVIELSELGQKRGTISGKEFEINYTEDNQKISIKAKKIS